MKDRISISSLLPLSLQHAILQQDDGVTAFREDICISFCHQLPLKKGEGCIRSCQFVLFSLIYDKNRSIVQILDITGILLDEFLSWLNLFAHKQGEDLIGFDRILQADLF